MASERLGVAVEANLSITAVGAHARKQGAELHSLQMVGQRQSGLRRRLVRFQPIYFGG